MNNRHRQVNKLYMIRARMFVKRLPSAKEMLARSQVYQSRLLELTYIHNQVFEKLENYLKNLRKES